MNRLVLYFLALIMLFVYSCKQTKNAENLNSKADSVVNTFSWTYVQDLDRDSTYAYLNKLLQNKQLNTLSRFKLYGSICAYYYLGQKDYPKAALYADSMILIIEKSDPEKYAKELALAYYSKGDVLFAVGKFDESFKCYYHAKKIMSVNKDNCISSDYSYRIGMVLYKQGKYADAGYFFSQGFEESSACLQDFPQIFRRQELLNNVALCYAKRNKLDSALLAYNRALNFINQHDTIADRKVMFNVARGVVYGNMGGVFAKKKDQKRAEALLVKSIAINVKPGFENNDAALTQVKLVKLYLATEQLDKAASILADLKSSVVKTKLPEASLNYHQLMAEYLGKIGEKDQAFAHLAIYTKLQDSAQKEQTKLNATDINERFRNLDSQNEIDYLKREQQLQTLYLYIVAIFSVMTIAIILLIYFYWKKSRKNVRELTQLNHKVSVQKQLLEHTLINLEKTDEEKNRILRAVAHDLRNPLSGVVSLTTLMLADDQSEEEREKHQLIKDTCVGALNLINELIEAAENNDRKPIVERRHIDIVALIENAIELQQFKAKEKLQVINFNTQKPQIWINANGEQILRVVNNLLSNAIKFSYEHTAIEVNINIHNNVVKIWVKDQGMGIPAPLVDKIFKTFTDAKRAGTNGERSYGLGLSISKQIIDAHGGEIGLENGASGGASFYFSLPIAKEI